MTTHALDYFRDENPGVFRSHPLEVIRAATLAAAGNPFVDSNDRPGAERVVYYYDPDAATPAEIRLVLRMVEHDGGAFDKTAAMATTDGDTEGRIMHSDGTMAAVHGEEVTSLRGVFFANYYTLHKNRIQAATVVTDQDDGDWYWLVVEGPIELLAGTDTIDVGEPVVSADDAEGGMAEVPIAVTDTSVDDAWAEIEEHLPRYVIGYAVEDAAHDAFATVFLDLRRFGARDRTY